MSSAGSSEDAVGFVGLGIMGEGMARNLLKDGRSLMVWNRSPGKAEALAEEFPGKVAVAATPQEVVESCGLTYAMLSTPAVVHEVYEMGGGLLSGVQDGKAIVDCATLAVEDMQRIAAQVAERGGVFLEAPVSGSKGPAATGNLIFLAGGDQALFDSIAEDLEAMGKSSFYLGEVGAGTRMKLCVNMAMSTMLAGYGEALSLAQAAGLDPRQLLDVMELGVCASPLLAGKGAKMVDGDHDTNFPLKHAEKDMRLAVELGASNNLALPLATAADAAMQAAMDAGRADQDFSAVFEAQKHADATSYDRAHKLLTREPEPEQGPLGRLEGWVDRGGPLKRVTRWIRKINPFSRGDKSA
jgi:3-hydroxyisobutyrate dehydrogenase-like beta-hydroxyacid dehydrogenase